MIISEYLSLHKSKSVEIKRLYTLSLLNTSLDERLKKLHLPYKNHTIKEKVLMIDEIPNNSNYLRDLCLDLIKCLELIEDKKVFVEGSGLTKIKTNNIDVDIYPSYIYDKLGNIIKIKTNRNISLVNETISLIDLIEEKLPEIRNEKNIRVLKL